jgi:hypothetical protein
VTDFVTMIIVTKNVVTMIVVGKHSFVGESSYVQD